MIFKSVQSEAEAEDKMGKSLEGLMHFLEWLGSRFMNHFREDAARREGVPFCLMSFLRFSFGV